MEIRDLLSLHPHRTGTTIKDRKRRKTSTSTIQVMIRGKRRRRTFSKIIGKISGTAQAWTVKSSSQKRARVRTFIGRRLSESNENIKEEVEMRVPAPQKTPSGKMVEASHIAAISILKVKIHSSSSRNGHIVKRRRKKLKKMSFTDNITKNTTSSRASNISRGKPMRGKGQATTKIATSISLNQLGSARNRSQRHTRNMNPKKIPCSTR